MKHINSKFYQRNGRIKPVCYKQGAKTDERIHDPKKLDNELLITNRL